LVVLNTVSAKTGKRMLAVAVLDATSVMVAVITQTINIMTKGGRTLSPDNCSPNHSDSPDTRHASERANPLPVHPTKLIVIWSVIKKLIMSSTLK